MAPYSLSNMKPICPNCKDRRNIREILYGLPEEPVDEKKYSIGGCLVWEGRPLFLCRGCGWISTELPPAPKDSECLYCGQSSDLQQINFRIEEKRQFHRFIWDGTELETDSEPIYQCNSCHWRGGSTNLTRTQRAEPK